MALASKIGNYSEGANASGTDLEATIDSILARVNSVTNEQVATDAISTDRIVNLAVTLAKIANGAFTADTTGRGKFASNFVTRALQDKEALGAGAYVRFTHSTNSDGGTSSTGLWNDRVINTLAEDRDSIGASLSATPNHFNLPAGDYMCHIVDVAHQTNGHQARLRNATAATVLLTSTSGYETGANDATAVMMGEVTIANSTDDILIEHYTQTGRGTFGMGRDANSGSPNLFCIAEFWKIS